MTDDRDISFVHPTVSTFDDVQHALEEAESRTKAMHAPYCVVGTAIPDGSVVQYLVMERSRAMATAAVILETFRVMDSDPARGIN